MIDLAKIFDWAMLDMANHCSKSKAACLTSALLRTGPLACGLMLSAAAAHAQDPFGAADPFGMTAPAGATPDAATAIGNAAPANTPEPSTSNAAAAVEETDPLVRILRISPPRSPEQYAAAIQSMLGIRRWDEVGRYIDGLQSAGWSRDQLDQLSRAGGTGLWFQLLDATTELNDAQRNFVRQLAALPAELARDPAWIDSWLNRLASPKLAERREAQSKLLRSRRAGIERLCTGILAGHPNVPGHALAEAVLAFEAEGVDALRAACAVPDGLARARALIAVAQTSSTEFSAEIGSGLESDALPSQGREAITKIVLQRYGKVPDSNVIGTYLNDRFKRQLDQYQLMRSKPSRVGGRVWRSGPDGKSIVSVEASMADQALESLAQVAMHRIAYSKRTSDDVIDCATVLLQQAYQAQPGVETTGVAWQRLGIAAEDAARDDFWKQVLDRSQKWQMHGASLRSAQMIARQIDGAKPGAAIFDFLADCMRDSKPAMRYVAVEALAKADVSSPYNGSALALETAIEMSRLSRGPMVLVVGLSSDLRASAEQQLLALGAQTLTAVSTKDALQLLDQPYPVEMILIVDRLPTNSILTTVDRLRNSKRGGALPIGVLTEDLEASRRIELQRIPGVVLSLLSHEPSHMPRVLAELQRQLDTRPLSSEERLTMAATGLSFVTTISSDREKYAFYPLARWESELTSLSSTLPTESYLGVLGGMGTINSQSQLVRVAADGSYTKDARVAAAAAFARSISQFGLLLNQKSIEQAYELYNTQGPSDAVTVSALGQVLDAIETKTGKAE